jgi:hypothetical protein
MATFSFTINQSIPKVEIDQTQEVVQITSTSTNVTVSQNGVALVGTPGPTGPTGPTGTTGPTGATGATGPAGGVSPNPIVETIQIGSTIISENQFGDIYGTAYGSITGSDPIIIDAFPNTHPDWIHAKYTVQVTDNISSSRDSLDFHISEITLVSSGRDTPAYFTENNIMENNGLLGTFNVNNNGGYPILYFTPTDAVGMKIRVLRTMMGFYNRPA